MWLSLLRFKKIRILKKKKKKYIYIYIGFKSHIVITFELLKKRYVIYRERKRDLQVNAIRQSTLAVLMWILNR